MKTSQPRTALLLAAVCLAWPAPAETATAGGSKPDAATRDYVRYTGDDKRGKLETAIVTMQKDGAVVELIGAVHIADAAYYKALTQLFAGYEGLLFELVDGQRLKEDIEGTKRRARAKARQPKPGTNPPEETPAPAETIPAPEDGTAPEEEERDLSPAIKLISGMMHGLGSYFHFQYQTEGIDYHTKNFVHADVSMDEFERLQADKGESFTGLMHKALEAQLELGPHREAEPKGSQLLLALLGDSSGLKVAMARQLAVADDLVVAMEQGGGSVIISERNRKALEVFDREIAAGRRKLGIFYGAAHLHDIEARLEKRGYTRTGERWLAAWDIKPRADAKRQPAAPKE